MTHADLTALKHAEEAKRDRHIDPATRWHMIQQLITWADAQRPVPRNSMEGCLAAQRRLLERLAEWEQRRRG